MELDREALNRIEGWLMPPAEGLTERLVQRQIAERQATGVLELGVHKGRYLALLAALHADAHVPVVGVDALLDEGGTPLAPEWRATAKATIRNNVASVAGEVDLTVVGAFTRDLDLDSLRVEPGFSFVSVDAGHDADDVIVDLGIAESLASPAAVVAVDDFFNARVPGVPEGLCRYMLGVTELRPFATGGNKMFLACTAEAHARYLGFCHGVMDRDLAGFVRSSAAFREVQRRQGYVPRFFGCEVATFLYDGE